MADSTERLDKAIERFLASPIPTLTEWNFSMWKQAILGFTATYGLGWSVNTDIPIPHSVTRPDKARVHTAVITLMRVKISEAAAQRVPASTWNNTPIQALAAVQSFIDDTSPERHASLEVRAKALTIGSKSVSEYFEGHRQLRAKMVQAQYPNIGDERTTNRFITEGLYDNPNYRVVLETMDITPLPATVLEYQTKLEMREARMNSIHALAKTPVTDVRSGNSCTALLRHDNICRGPPHGGFRAHQAVEKIVKRPAQRQRRAKRAHVGRGGVSTGAVAGRRLDTAHHAQLQAKKQRKPQTNLGKLLLRNKFVGQRR